jgi:hypothetical protein
MQTGFVDVCAPTNKPSGLDFLSLMGTVRTHRGSTAQRAFCIPRQPRSRRDCTGLNGLQASNTPSRRHLALVDPNLIEVSDIARRSWVRQAAREGINSSCALGFCTSQTTEAENVIAITLGILFPDELTKTENAA